MSEHKDITIRVDQKDVETLGRLAATLSHKINNPLTYILNYTFILMNTVKDPNSQNMLKKIEEGVTRTKEILHKLVDASKPLQEPLVGLDLKSELPKVLSGYFAHGEAIRTNTSFHGTCLIMATKKGLFQLLASILDNSVDAGATEISIDCMSKGNEVSASITDNGSGVHPENMDRIFEPFFTTKPGSDGLGLYTAYHLARHMGGSLKCEVRGNQTFFVLSFSMAATEEMQ